MVADAQKLCWNPKVSCRTLEGTAFILLKSQMISLSEVGTKIWDLFEQGTSLSQVVPQIVAQYEVGEDVAWADARNFVGTLVEKGMLISVD